MSSNSFKDLIVWQRALQLSEEVYRAAAVLPKYEDYGLASQLRRAAISIPSNIAEGAKRGSKKDFLQFLRIASGSAAELETQLMLAAKLHSVNVSSALATLTEVQKMLTVFVRTMH